jgi:hypothetical protein
MNPFEIIKPDILCTAGAADEEEKFMEIMEVQPLLKVSSILQWGVIVLVFLAGTLQIAKIYVDKKIDSVRHEVILGRVEEYEKTILDLKTKAKQQFERRQVTLEEKKDRRIPDHMLPQVRAELSKFQGASVRLACDKNDKEALAFAEQLKSLFEEAGWSVAGINQTQYSKPVKEVVIILNHEAQKEKANYIFSLLMALDVKSSARLNKNQPEDLGIIVGKNE